MTSSVSKAQVLSLYKILLRESQKISNYNFRSYAVRRVTDAFKENKSLTDAKEITKRYDFAKENLAIIRRQIINLAKGELILLLYTGVHFIPWLIREKTLRVLFHTKNPSIIII